MTSAFLTAATWNTEWRTPGSADGQLMLDRLAGLAPDVICLTEGYAELLGAEGYCISSEADYGYPLVEGRRKVVLWSRNLWDEVDSFGHPELPSGRFVMGRTNTPIGELRVVGLCIPWRDAHVRTGRRDRECWQDHLAYLAALKELTADWSGPTLILGDFNQRVPARYGPDDVHTGLKHALLDRYEIATAGELEPLGRQAIDHILHSADLKAEPPVALSNIADNGRQISDHFGVAVRLTSNAR